MLFTALLWYPHKYEPNKMNELAAAAKSGMNVGIALEIDSHLGRWVIKTNEAWQTAWWQCRRDMCQFWERLHESKSISYRLWHLVSRKLLSNQYRKIGCKGV